MFRKKKDNQDNKILLEIYRFMEQKTLSWKTAEQVLEKLFQMIGKEVDCFIMVLLKKRRNLYLQHFRKMKHSIT